MFTKEREVVPDHQVRAREANTHTCWHRSFVTIPLRVAEKADQVLKFFKGFFPHVSPDGKHAAFEQKLNKLQVIAHEIL